ncbi:hybrid sensor histidine kinase/response regulator [Catenuloplanes atrovinosus]|nr:PAS domain S-box protein [Catenuloplanes atrovinosus]
MALVAVTTVYVVILGWMAFSYLRRRDPLLRDAMWVFASVSLLFVLGVIQVFAESVPPVVTRVFLALLFAKPVITLRLVGRLRRVPWWALAGATVAWAGTALPVLLSRDVPLPRPVIGAASGVFFALEVLAAGLLAAQAGRRAGAARIRLRYAAAATALFGTAVLVMAGGPAVAVHARLLALVSGLLYLLAFVPPRWLRRSWSSGAAYAMSRHMLTAPPDAPATRTWQHYCRCARQVLGCDLVAVVFPGAGGCARVLTDAEEPLIDREVDEREVRDLLAPPLTIDALAGWTHPPAVAVELVAASGTRFVTATPFDTRHGRAALVMLNRYRTLFADDDVALYTELAAHAAALAERAAMLAERERLAGIVQSSHDAIIGKTLDGVITSWNAGAERIYGYRAEEIIGRNAAVLLPPGRQQLERDLLRRIAAGERIELEHLQRRCKDGHAITVSLTLSPILDSSGQIAGVASISRDITERQRAESMFHELLESAPDAMVGVRRDGTVTLINAQAERMFGYDREEMLGRNIEMLVPERFRAAHPGLRARYFADPVPRRLGAGTAVTAVRKDGSEFPVEISLSALETGEGTVVSAAIRDVTDRLIAQAERDRLIAQAERDAGERRLQNARRLESLGKLAGGVAHDFNNILAVIGNYTEMLIDTFEEATALGPDEIAAARADLGHIRRAAERATGLTKQLLAFGRRDVTRAQVLSLNHVIGDAEEMLRRALGSDVHLITQLDRDLWTVHADSGRLEQMLAHLCDNARDAMPAGGTLFIDTSNVELGPDDVAGNHLKPGRYVRLRVSDTGCGMPREVVERAMEPFYTTKPRGSGTGLGLATVYGIATAAGGDVHLYSEVDIGTTVTILLPAADQPAAPASTGGTGRPAAPETGERGHETILMIEDEDALRQITGRILTRAGYQVLSADGGAKAIHLAQTHPERIDLLLTDVIMPGMTGNEAAARITEIRPGTPVLYMSGYAEPVLTSNGTLHDGVVMIEKPFTSRELLQRVRTVLNQHAPH